MKRKILVVLIIFGIVFSGVNVDFVNVKAQGEDLLLFYGIIESIDNDSYIDVIEYTVRIKKLFHGSYTGNIIFVLCSKDPLPGGACDEKIQVGDSVTVFGQRGSGDGYPQIPHPFRIRKTENWQVIKCEATVRVDTYIMNNGTWSTQVKINKVLEGNTSYEGRSVDVRVYTGENCPLWNCGYFFDDPCIYGCFHEIPTESFHYGEKVEIYGVLGPDEYISSFYQIDLSSLKDFYIKKIGSPTPKTGSIKIIVKDEDGYRLGDVLIYLDGQYKGKTDTNGSSGEYIISNLPPNNYIVKASKSGYYDDSESVYVESGKTKTVYLTLKEIPSPTTAPKPTTTPSPTTTPEPTTTPSPSAAGSIKVIVKDENGNKIEGAMVDGDHPIETCYFTDSNGECLIKSVKEGRYTIRASKDGYEGDSEQVYVSAGETETVYLELEKIPSPTTMPSPTTTPAPEEEYYYFVETKDGKIYILSEKYDDASVKEYYIKKRAEAYESVPHLVKWGIALYLGGAWALAASILSDGVGMYLKGEKTVSYYYEIAKNNVKKPVYDSKELMIGPNICTPNAKRLPTGKFFSWNDFLPIYNYSECSGTSSYIPYYIKTTLSAQAFGEFCRFDRVIGEDYFIPVYINVDPIFYDDSFIKEAQKKAGVETIKVTLDALISYYLQNSLQISLKCPVDLHLYNSKNSHVGINYKTGQVEMNIPNSLYFKDGEEVKILIENPRDTYKVDLIGKNKGTFNLSIKYPQDNKVKNIAYKDESVTSQTKAEIEISPSSDYTMKMDRDGDGVFEKKIKPDKIEAIKLGAQEESNKNFLLFGVIIAIIIASIVLVYSRGYFPTHFGRPKPPVRERPIVRQAPKGDIGKGIVRMDKKTRELYGVKPGEEITIEGKKEAKGTVKPALKKDAGKGIMRVDKKLRKKAGVKPGETVEIISKKAPILEVHKAKKEDAGKKIVRIDKKTREKLGIEKGDSVYVVGEKKVKARVETAYKEDAGKNIIRMNKKLRKKAGVNFKDKVEIEKVEEDEV